MERTGSRTSLVRLVLTLAIVELNAVTAYLHLSLGGELFTLNAYGYFALGATYAAAVLLPIPSVQRFAWLPRVGLLAYALVTIGAYLVMGPYYWIGWTAKGIEVAIVALLTVDLVGAYRNPGGLWRAVIESVPFIGTGPGPRHS